MTALRVANLVLSLLVSCALLFCGAILFALRPWLGGLFWPAAGLCFVAMWGAR